VGSPVSSRRVCLVLNPRIAAAEISVRRLARTSVSTCIRFRSRSLIITSPIPLVSLLMAGTMTFLKSAYSSTVHKLRYRNCRRGCRECDFFMRLRDCFRIARTLPELRSADLARQGSRSALLRTAAAITRNTSSLFNKRAGFAALWCSISAATDSHRRAGARPHSFHEPRPLSCSSTGRPGLKGNE
jgi:hypothetical protein